MSTTPIRPNVASITMNKDVDGMIPLTQVMAAQRMTAKQQTEYLGAVALNAASQAFKITERGIWTAQDFQAVTLIHNALMALCDNHADASSNVVPGPSSDTPLRKTVSNALQAIIDSAEPQPSASLTTDSAMVASPKPAKTVVAKLTPEVLAEGSDS